tara:strand:+ start:7654 stop:9099 length:1446 start_codon:yes stop_codon:yes gene_type:complete
MSRTGNGALIALNAIGKQDQILYNLDSFDETQSPFNHEHTQYSHYTKFYKSYVREPSDGSATWPFTGDGVKVGFILDPRVSGDLLTNMFLKMSLPAISDGLWTDKLGRAIIQSIEFRVDSIVVDKLTDLDLVVRDELFTTEHDKTVKNYLQNGRLYKNSMTKENLRLNPDVLPLSPNHNKSAKEFYIDLGFCFNRRHDYKPEAFPICAVSNQNIYIDIQFRPVTWFTNTTSVVGASKVTLVTEQVSLSEQERLFMSKSPLTFRYKNIQPLISVQTDTDANSISQTSDTSGSVDSLTVQLKGSRKTSAILWTFQNRRFKNLAAQDSLNSNLFLNRYNFSSHENYSAISPLDGGYVEPYYGFNEVNFPLCSKIELLYSKNDLRLLYADNSSGTIPSTSSFFRNISSQTRGLYTPSKNIFSHCFEDEPMSPIMSGSHIDTLNDYKLFTTLINNPEVRSNVYDLHIFTISYFELEFKDGYLIKKI